jgi:hypothetical protein
MSKRLMANKFLTTLVVVFGLLASSPVHATLEEGAPPKYEAVLSCGIGGNYINILVCFQNSDIRVTTGNITSRYGVHDVLSLGKEYRDGIHFLLPEHFKIEAQNSDSDLTLSLIIKNADGKVLFQDQVGQYRTIAVEN